MTKTQLNEALSEVDGLLWKSDVIDIFNRFRRSELTTLAEQLEDMKIKYCTSGCGCEYPYGDNSHKRECVWKIDSTDPQNIFIDRVLSLITSLIETK